MSGWHGHPSDLVVEPVDIVCNGLELVHGHLDADAMEDVNIVDERGLPLRRFREGQRGVIVVGREVELQAQGSGAVEDEVVWVDAYQLVVAHVVAVVPTETASSRKIDEKTVTKVSHRWPFLHVGLKAFHMSFIMRSSRSAYCVPRIILSFAQL